MKHCLQFLVVGLWISVCVAELPSSVSIDCTNRKGPICVIASLPPSDGIKSIIEFPDVSKRTGLRVMGGKLSNLSEAQALKLTVGNVWMEGLDLQSVFVSPQFVKLHLRRNLLSTLQTSTSSSPSYALKLLDVRQNVLKNVSQLAPFVLLEELYLDDNQISDLSIDLFAKMQNLRVLSAAGNGIVKIVPPATVLVLEELQSLSLAHNRLTSIGMEKWHLPALQTLRLNNNSLQELTGMNDFNQLYDLKEMSLAGNKWSCGWLQRALGKVIVRSPMDDAEGVVLDADPNCSIEKVFDICCSFTPMPDHGEEQLFLPEIEQVRDAIRQINSRHEAFMRYQNETMKRLHETLELHLNSMTFALAGQENELERGKLQAAQIRNRTDELQERYAKVVSNIALARSVEQQRKRLLHFMVDMKNKLVGQAIDTDRLWVQANEETIRLAQQVETS